ncbi:thioredoxin [archaeon BMS3Bbin15]|nr:thioredoxin [archaeon BMS3Bbin15]
MDEVELIKKKKLEEMLKRTSKSEQENRVEYPDSPVYVNDSTLEETVRKYPLLLVDFYADWCAPCKMVAPVLEEIVRRDLHGKLVVAKINVDENSKSAMKYQAMSIPTMIIFKNGQIVERIVGALPKSAILSKIRRYL